MPAIYIKIGQSKADHRVSYLINGAIYLLETSTLIKQKTHFPTPGAFAYIMKRDESIDVDTELDLYFAECLMTRRA